jgi:hypothetical protein
VARMTSRGTARSAGAGRTTVTATLNDVSGAAVLSVH